MSLLAVRVENLYKQYRIGAYRNVDSLREQAAEVVRRLLLRPAKTEELPEANTIWALSDVSFEVQQGEVVGIVGHNGAGKSTLLKILSRITRPTSGRIEVYGRVSSLLEVGTGFHPELTGRENIYMNAAILGMKRREILRKFDEIVEFAGVEKFIDTPVKRYSSGMYVRLAFSVAAHLEPDILIVDEVLTVGDAEFQKRSLGKMDTASKQGRTILFVSHNLGALAALCPRSILLRNGQKIMDDRTAQVIAEYVKTTAEHNGERTWVESETAPGNEKVRLQRVRILCDGRVTSDVDIVKDVQLEFEFWNFSPGEKLSVGILVLDKMGTEVMASANFRSANLVEDEWTDRPFEVGLFRVSCTIPGNLLNAGRYTIDLYINSNVLNSVLLERGVIAFNVYESGAMREEYQGLWRGVVRPKLAWHTKYVEPLHAMETTR